jgi:hypothetical protein
MNISNLKTIGYEMEVGVNILKMLNRKGVWIFEKEKTDGHISDMILGYCSMQKVPTSHWSTPKKLQFHTPFKYPYQDHRYLVTKIHTYHICHYIHTYIHTYHVCPNLKPMFGCSLILLEP